MRKELERIEIPDEHEARERSWAVVRVGVRRARADTAATVVEADRCGRGGARRRRRPPEPARPGRPRRDPRGRRGREGATRALLAAGPRPAARDLGRGRLGRRRGRLEAAARQLPRGVLVAVRALRRRGAARTSSPRSTPDGDLRWSLARPNVRFPRWGGTRDRHADRLPLERASCASSPATATGDRAARSAGRDRPGQSRRVMERPCARHRRDSHVTRGAQRWSIDASSTGARCTTRAAPRPQQTSPAAGARGRRSSPQVRARAE